MRTSVFVLTLALSLPGCDTAPRLTVVHVHPGNKLEPLAGDSLKIRRGPRDVYRGVHGGYFVIRTVEDWRAVWSTAKRRSEPPIPPTLDMSRSMLLLAVSDSKWTGEVKVTKVVDTGTGVDVWIRETKVGEGCAPKKLADAFDAVVVDRLDKPVRFLVAEDKAESCGPPPTTEVRCRLGASPSWAAEIAAQPGDTIECEMTARSRGKFVVVDRMLSLAEMPGGSAAKLVFPKGPAHATMTLDVFGSYAVKAEVTDEANRKGFALAKIDASAPKTRDVLVELVWTGFDASDDPETFPRTVLAAQERPQPLLRNGQGPRDATGRRCTAEEQAPGFCEAKRHGPYTRMRLSAGEGRVPLSVSYLDERVDKGPLACVQIWLDGKRTAEACDRQPRAADETWDLGAVDLSTGALSPGRADAGAPDVGPPARPARPKKP